MVIDHARQTEAGAWVAQHSGLMFSELQLAHPGAVLGDEDSFLAAQARAFTTVPEEITRARFAFALSQRKVLDHTGDGDSESFKLAEMTIGNITTIYARRGSRFWLFQDVATLAHRLIIQRVSACG
jgi:PmbA protein